MAYAISELKKIFGDAPINHLSAAQALAKKKQNINLIIFGLVAAVGVGFFIGFKYADNKNSYDFKPKQKFEDEKENIDGKASKFKNYSSNNNIPIKS